MVRFLSITLSAILLFISSAEAICSGKFRKKNTFGSRRVDQYVLRSKKYLQSLQKQKSTERKKKLLLRKKNREEKSQARKKIAFLRNKLSQANQREASAREQNVEILGKLEKEKTSWRNLLEKARELYDGREEFKGKYKDEKKETSRLSSQLSDQEKLFTIQANDLLIKAQTAQTKITELENDKRTLAANNLTLAMDKTNLETDKKLLTAVNNNLKKDIAAEKQKVTAEQNTNSQLIIKHNQNIVKEKAQTKAATDANAILQNQNAQLAKDILAEQLKTQTELLKNMQLEKDKLALENDALIDKAILNSENVSLKSDNNKLNKDLLNEKKETDRLSPLLIKYTSDNTILESNLNQEKSAHFKALKKKDGETQKALNFLAEANKNMDIAEKENEQPKNQLIIQKTNYEKIFKNLNAELNKIKIDRDNYQKLFIALADKDCESQQKIAGMEEKIYRLKEQNKKIAEELINK